LCIKRCRPFQIPHFKWFRAIPHFLISSLSSDPSFRLYEYHHVIFLCCRLVSRRRSVSISVPLALSVNDTTLRRFVAPAPTPRRTPICNTPTHSDTIPIYNTRLICDAKSICSTRPICDARPIYRPIYEIRPICETRPICDARSICNTRLIGDARPICNTKPICDAKPIYRPIYDTISICELDQSIYDARPIYRPIYEAIPICETRLI
jgi:hypothetical protein